MRKAAVRRALDRRTDRNIRARPRLRPQSMRRLQGPRGRAQGASHRRSVARSARVRHATARTRARLQAARIPGRARHRSDQPRRPTRYARSGGKGQPFICYRHFLQQSIFKHPTNLRSLSTISQINLKKIIIIQKNINDLQASKQNLIRLNDQIIALENEVKEKKNLHSEYTLSASKFDNDLKQKQQQLHIVKQELSQSSIKEAELLKKQIEILKNDLSTLTAKISLLAKEIAQFNNNKAVSKHNIDQKTNDKIKKINLKQELLSLQNQASKYPAVIQGFSSSGIPNLIIQDVLDDLQIESNQLLDLLKPGLQLSFLIEKDNEEHSDTLDIKYNINGKERYYEQLSGAMKLAVSFSKIGIIFRATKEIRSRY